MSKWWQLRFRRTRTSLHQCVRTTNSSALSVAEHKVPNRHHSAEQTHKK